MNFMFKVYVGDPKQLLYTTYILDDAIRKYFIHTKEGSVIEIWKDDRYIGEYNLNRYELKTIKNDIECIIAVV